MRREAAVFLDSLAVGGVLCRRDWVARWTSIGDAHCLVGDLNIDRGAFDEAIEARLCALTAFEVGRRLVGKDDSRSRDVSAKIGAEIQWLGSLEQRVERVRIDCWGEVEIPAYYLCAGDTDFCGPAIVCISREEETAAMLLGRLLPSMVDRGISLLLVSHGDLANDWRGQAEALLSCCLDYLSARPDIDATRIGIYGEGLSAALATDVAVSDRRVAAAVCDGGLWSWARVLASVNWVTRKPDVLDEDVVSELRSRLVRQVRCPVLVVVSGRGVVSVPEAIKLQADCTAARSDLELFIPRSAWTSVGEIENFVTSDDRVFGWLERKLATFESNKGCRPVQQ